MEKKKLKALTIKIHPDLLDEVDRRIDGVRFRSRAHLIGCAVLDFIDAVDPKNLDEKEIARRLEKWAPLWNKTLSILSKK